MLGCEDVGVYMDRGGLCELREARKLVLVNEDLSVVGDNPVEVKALS